jgi:hypothetical protein
VTNLIDARGDGCLFPEYEGQALCWHIGSYNSWEEKLAGYPRMRTVLRAMIEHRPAEVERERREMLKASFDRMFGHVAKETLLVIEQELACSKS